MIAHLYKDGVKISEVEVPDTVTEIGYPRQRELILCAADEHPERVDFVPCGSGEDDVYLLDHKRSAQSAVFRCVSDPE